MQWNLEIGLIDMPLAPYCSKSHRRAALFTHRLWGYINLVFLVKKRATSSACSNRPSPQHGTKDGFWLKLLHPRTLAWFACAKSPNTCASMRFYRSPKWVFVAGSQRSNHDPKSIFGLRGHFQHWNLGYMFTFRMLNLLKGFQWIPQQTRLRGDSPKVVRQAGNLLPLQ